MNDDFGMAVSLLGYNASTASDQFLYFNSAWPLIKIDTSLSDTLSLDGFNPKTITHNLGYPPLVFVWSHNNGFFPYYLDSINSQTVTFLNLQGITDEIQYYICRNPLNTNFLAPNILIAGSGKGQTAGNYGVKFSKPSYDASTDTDYRHFTLHSATKSLQIHQVIYQQLGQFEDIEFGLPDFPDAIGLKYTTDLPYRPIFFAFYSSDNENFVPVFTNSQVPPKIAYDSIDESFIITSLTPGWGVFFVLLDPYYSTDQFNVTL